MPLKLKYETGVAVTIQFVAVTILNFVGGSITTIKDCTGNSTNCISNLVISVLYFGFLTLCFGFLWIVGFIAQDRRSIRLSKILIFIEGFVFLFGLYEFSHYSSSITKTIIGLVEIITAIWVSWLALRILRAKGGRVRVRQIRPHQKSS